MIDKGTLSLMADIMNGITSADEWTRIQTNDPGIAAADDMLDKALRDAKPYLPRAIYEELSNASVSIASAYSDAGILYGIHVATVIRDVTARPEGMSWYYLERKETQGKTW